jgi:hypothetical protein
MLWIELHPPPYQKKKKRKKEKRYAKRLIPRISKCALLQNRIDVDAIN